MCERGGGGEGIAPYAISQNHIYTTKSFEPAEVERKPITAHPETYWLVRGRCTTPTKHNLPPQKNMTCVIATDFCVVYDYYECGLFELTLKTTSIFLISKYENFLHPEFKH